MGEATGGEGEREYAVDTVIGIMNKLAEGDVLRRAGGATTKPVMFQRDGALFVASRLGFGWVSNGLHVYPAVKDWQNLPQHEEILASREIKKEEVSGKEKPHISPIAFGEDDNRFSLEHIASAAERLAKLPDDRRIRMISHCNRYHSHKYGYACDGIDVWVDTARVMGREKYLKIMRKRESEVLGKIVELKGYTNERHDCSLAEYYCKYIKIPDCVILTPYMLFSFPRKARLDVHRGEAPETVWDRETRLYSGDGMRRFPFDFADYEPNKESPYAAHLLINTQRMAAKDVADFGGYANGIVDAIGRQLNAVGSEMEHVQGFLAQINAAHNEGCAKEIKEHKDWERSCAKSRAARVGR